MVPQMVPFVYMVYFLPDRLICHTMRFKHSFGDEPKTAHEDQHPLEDWHLGFDCDA